jgi:SAM-dependent methyltransferase
VLDAGCGTGVAAVALANLGCRVVGIDRDAYAVKTARAAGIEAYEVDLDDERAIDQVPGPFDTVVCLDVLPYLQNPLATLLRLAACLHPGGELIISTPNVAHVAVRLNLLGGRFSSGPEDPRPVGQLHYFDRDAMDDLLEAAGLHVLDFLTIQRSLDETRMTVDRNLLSPEITRLLAESDADVYQWVVRAGFDEIDGRPDPPMLTLYRHFDQMRQAAATAEQRTASANSRARAGEQALHQVRFEFQEAARTALDRERALEAELADLRYRFDDSVATRESQLQVLHQEVDRFRGELSESRTEVERVRADLRFLERHAEAERLRAQIELDALRKHQDRTQAELDATRQRSIVRLADATAARLSGRRFTLRVLQRLAKGFARRAPRELV